MKKYFTTEAEVLRAIERNQHKIKECLGEADRLETIYRKRLETACHLRDEVITTPEGDEVYEAAWLREQAAYEKLNVQKLRRQALLLSENKATALKQKLAELRTLPLKGILT